MHELPSAGPNAPRDVDALAARLANARERGVVVADEDSEAGVVAVAAPVRALDGGIVAAVNVSAPKFRFFDALPDAGPAVKATADRLSGILGWNPTTTPRYRRVATRVEAP